MWSKATIPNSSSLEVGGLVPKDIYCVAEWSLRSGVYSRTVGKRRGFVVLIGPELGAVPSVQRILVKVPHPSTVRRWVGRLLQLIALLGSEALAACRIAVPRPEMRVRLGLALHPSSAKVDRTRTLWHSREELRLLRQSQHIGAVSISLEAYQALKVFPGPSALKPCRPHVPLQFRHLASRSSAPTG